MTVLLQIKLIFKNYTNTLFFNRETNTTYQLDYRPNTNNASYILNPFDVKNNNCFKISVSQRIKNISTNTEMASILTCP